MAAAPGCGPVPGVSDDREAVGGPVSAAGRSRHGRPFITAKTQPVADGDADGAAHHRAASQPPLGPARIGWLLGLYPSTVHRVLSRFKLVRLAWPDRGTGRVIRRYEHTHAGSLVQAKVPLIRDFVPRAGLEPATYGLEGRCSIH
jgi:hypothetical protein